MNIFILLLLVFIIFNLLYILLLYYALQTNVFIFRSKQYEIPFGKENDMQKKGTLYNPKIRYWRCDNPEQVENRWVILFHSWGRNSARMHDAATIYWQRGFSLIFLDALAHGQSEFKLASSALGFAQDAKRVMEQEHITTVPYVHGLSFGAIAATVYANKFGAQVIVAEALMTHPYKMMQDFLHKLHTPKYYYFIVDLVWRKEFPWEEVTVCDILPKLTCPIYLIHGEQDSLFPVARHFKPNWDLIKDLPHTQSWVVPDSEHSKMHLHHDFAANVGKFIDGCLEP